MGGATAESSRLGSFLSHSSSASGSLPLPRRLSLAMHVWWAAPGLRVEEVRWFGTLVLLVLVSTYYWRLAAQVRHVAEAAGEYSKA